MIKKLKFRFVTTIMIILSLVFILILSLINYLNYQSNASKSSKLLNELIANDGEIREDDHAPHDFLDQLPPNFYEREKTLSVKLDSNSTILEINGDPTNSDLTKEFQTEINTILVSGNESGSIDDYQYLIAKKPYGKLLVLVDQRISNALTDQLLMTSMIIGILTLIVLFFVSLFLANLMVKPVEEAFEKQKQFISDASHELKTPLSVISVNAEVLSNEIGNNKYLSYIQSESSRMNGLINSLLSLAQLDSNKIKPIYSKFDLSSAALSIALTFESSAFEENIEYQLNIEDNLYYLGDRDQIKQIFAILIDNAIKHSNHQGLVTVSVKKVREKIQIEIFNSGLGIPDDQQDKIFERFYRYDESRSKETGSYGLGLSIAKSIIIEHKGKISVKSDLNHWTKFIVIL